MLGTKSDFSDTQEYAGIDPRATAMNPLWRIGYQIAHACSFVIEETDKYRKENEKLADVLKDRRMQ
ncbi:hypothetical protein [Chitinophaga pinensis]|uniref:Uncharacterized protein n=1 Tax=Chitinophaga pinensis TaxID=79329 RepID=A0A5C6M0Q0_9BACT|nr:hypothetical protein [Chitinophaga pinensis]TWW02594.1 hypothetical protein FEF09_01960 [Chitinophaga pinensis]